MVKNEIIYKFSNFSHLSQNRRQFEIYNTTIVSEKDLVGPILINLLYILFGLVTTT